MCSCQECFFCRIKIKNIETLGDLLKKKHLNNT